MNELASCSFRCCTDVLGDVVRSPVMADLLDAELGRIIEFTVPSIKVKRRSCDEPWFDELCKIAFRRKQAAYHRWRV